MLVICFRGKLSPLGVITSFAIHKSRRLHGNSCHCVTDLLSSSPTVRQRRRKIWWAIDQMRLKSFKASFQMLFDVKILKNINYERHASAFDPPRGQGRVQGKFLLLIKVCRDVPRRRLSQIYWISPRAEGGRGRETGSDFWALSSPSRNLRSDLANCFGAQPLPARLKTSLNALYMAFIIRF